MFFKKTRFVSITASILAVIGFIVYGIFFSNLFSIQAIDIIAPESLDINELRSDLYRQLDDSAFRFFSQRNIFFFNTDKASSVISNSVLVDTLHIQKSYPRTIRITLEGKKFQLLWYSKGGVWMIGSNGAIIGPTDQTTIASLPLDLLRKHYGKDSVLVGQHIQKRPVVPPLIVDATQQDAHEGLSVIDQDVLQTLMVLRDSAKKSGIDSAYTLYTRGDPSIAMVTQEGWELHMMLDRDVYAQLKNASTLLSSSIKKKRSKLKKVDVRFDNRLYYTLND